MVPIHGNDLALRNYRRLHCGAPANLCIIEDAEPDKDLQVLRRPEQLSHDLARCL